MDGERRMWRVATRALVWAGGVAFFILLSCGEPDIPDTSRWVEAARVPRSIKRINGLTAAPDGAVYAAGETRDGAAVVLKYDGRELKETFRATYGSSRFDSVRYGGGRIWAGGSRVVGKDYLPYCVRSSDGVNWEEFEIPRSLGFVGVSPYPCGDDFVWFVGGTAAYRALFATYDRGVWKKLNVPSEPEGSEFVVTEGGRAYYYYHKNGILALLISDDRGNTWARETVEVEYPLYEIRKPKYIKMAPAGETVYLKTDLYGKEEDFNLVGVVARDEAPPGRGGYDVAFASPHGPYFTDIKAMAFRSLSDGYAVGPMTSVALEDGKWLKEATPESWSPMFRLVATGPYSYWAIVDDTASSHDHILYEATFE
jgi:hypothetical protein